MRQFILPLVAIMILGPRCSNIWTGFGSYGKPSKTSNKYYTRNFKQTNPKLFYCRRYIDLDNKGLNANNPNEFSYFVFFENGFVLHNADCIKGQVTLDYSRLHSEDVGSYMIKGDTIYWGTRPGYIKRKSTPYYKGIITDSGLQVIESKFEKLLFLSLQ
jgi:hypothetical protein